MNSADIKNTIDQLESIESSCNADWVIIKNAICCIKELANNFQDSITRLEAAESQQVAQELVIKQLRDALDFIDSENASEEVLRRALQELAIPTSTEHLEAWYKSMVGEPVAWNYELTEEAFVRLSVAGINVDTPLHAIKPFKGSDGKSNRI